MRTLLLIFVIIFLYSCESGGEKHPITIEVKNQLKGIQFVHTADSFDKPNGQYRVYVMLRHTNKTRYKYLQLNAIYYDENGKEIAQSVGGPQSELMPGDSAVMYTGWLFPQYKDLPYKVVLNATN